MTITVINQPTYRTWLTNLIIRFRSRFFAGPKRPEGAFPHDPSNTIPPGYEKKYNVTISRLDFDELPADWSHRENWAPLVIRSTRNMKAKRMLIYYHGGGFVNPVVEPMWMMCGRLANDLEADVVVQTYTMVPHAGVHDNVDKLVRLYEIFQAKAVENGQELLLGGESAGGGITATMVLALHDRGVKLPSQIYMIAPVLELDLDNDESREREPYDAMLSSARLTVPLRGWATGPLSDPSALDRPPGPPTETEIKAMRHPYASPVRGDWSFLAEHKMPITIAVGTYDMLLPDSEAFAKICEDGGYDLTYIKADGAIHAYLLAAEVPGSSFFSPEADAGVKLLVDSIKRYSNS